VWSTIPVINPGDRTAADQSLIPHRLGRTPSCRGRKNIDTSPSPLVSDPPTCSSRAGPSTPPPSCSRIMPRDLFNCLQPPLLMTEPPPPPPPPPFLGNSHVARQIIVNSNIATDRNGHGALIHTVLAAIAIPLIHDTNNAQSTQLEHAVDSAEARNLCVYGMINASIKRLSPPPLPPSRRTRI